MSDDLKSKIFDTARTERRAQVHGETLVVREPTLAERDELDVIITDNCSAGSAAGIRAAAIILCAHREDGTRIFGREDFKKLCEAPARPLADLADKSLKACGFASESVDDVKKP